MKIVKFPKEVLEKAKIVGNIFEDIKIKNEALNKLAEILSSDSAFESDCVALDISNNQPVSKREKALAGVVSACYGVVHPLTSTCCHAKKTL